MKITIELEENEVQIVREALRYSIKNKTEYHQKEKSNYDYNDDVIKIRNIITKLK